VSTTSPHSFLPYICDARDEPFAVGANEIEQIRSAVVDLAGENQEFELGPWISLDFSRP
jgi:hypothetical protein